MANVYETALKSSSGGFGEYDWVERTLVEGAESLEDYEEMLDDPAGADLAGRWTRDDSREGSILDERGQVYRISNPLTAADRANGLSDGDLDGWIMVWVED